MKTTSNNRNFLFDNFKALMIFLVVFGHFIANFQGSGARFIRPVWQFIYLFHMPAFCFVSGYFSKKCDERIFEKILKNYIFPLIVFQLAFEAFNYLCFHKFTGATPNLTPYWTLWYLLSLAFWKIFFPLLGKLKFTFFWTLIFALGVGMSNSLGYPLSISRTFVLFPFFILGNYFCEKNLIEKLLAQKKVLLYVLGFAVLFGALFYVWKMRLPNGLYLNSYSYKKIGMSFKKGGFFRLLNLFLSFLCILAIFIFTPKKRCFLSEIGRNSMIPYLAHGFFLKLMLLHRFDFYTDLKFTFIGGAVFSFAVIFLFGKDRISGAYNAFFEKISAIFLKNE